MENRTGRPSSTNTWGPKFSEASIAVIRVGAQKEKCKVEAKESRSIWKERIQNLENPETWL